MVKQGAYFKDKAEAVEFYRNSEENLKDKPDWLIECIIDFAIQHPNYKEYLECESRINNGEELTAKQKKKYGHLKWAREKMNKYGLDFGEHLPPDDTVKIRVKQADGTEITGTFPVGDPESCVISANI